MYVFYGSSQCLLCVCVCVTGVASAICVYCYRGGQCVLCMCVTGVASAYAITLVIVSWILDPGIKNEAKHVKL